MPVPGQNGVMTPTRLSNRQKTSKDATGFDQKLKHATNDYYLDSQPMSKHPAWLQEYQFKIFSQSGEDGIVCKILEVIDKGDKWCVEFGALDGHGMSNTRNLIENHGYSAILIEADKKHFNR